MILVTNLVNGADAEARAALLETLERPCGNCGDLLHARMGLLVDEGVVTLCNACVAKEVPEQIASHPDHFAGALVSEDIAPRLIFVLELRRHHAAGRVPLLFRHLFNPRKWARA